MNSSSEQSKGAVHAFEFPEVASVVVSSSIDGNMWASAPEAEPEPSIQLRAANEMTAQARLEGRNEGEARVRQGFEELAQQLRGAVGKAIADFAEERASYFQRVEAEVVQLSLAIARKILHREAQIDSMLLASLVRSALTEMNQSSQVTLHVEPSAVAQWQTYFAKHSQHRLAPQIVPNPSMTNSCCLIQSEVGTTEINIESQLTEIEHGFFDLLAEKPRASMASKAVQ
jgi:flagellar assembly protein FliH